MKIFFKILFLITLILMLVVFLGYPHYQDILSEKIRVFFSEKVSEYTDYSINIETLDLSSLPLIHLSNVKISDTRKKQPSDPIIINDLRIGIDFLTLLKNKQLETTLYIDGLKMNGILASGLIKTYSSKSSELKDAFSLSRITNIAVINATLSSEKMKLKNINSNINIDALKIYNSVSSFNYMNKKYLLGYAPLPVLEEKKQYTLLLLSENLDLDLLATKIDNKNFTIDSLSGHLYCFDLDFSGHLKNLSLPEPDIYLEGNVTTDLADLEHIPGKLGKTLEKIDISGILNSVVTLKSTTLNLTDYDIKAHITGKTIHIMDIKLKYPAAEMTIKNGLLNIPDFSSDLCGGKLYGDIKLDLCKEGLPYIFYLSIDNMFLDEFIEDISGEFSKVYGNTFAKLHIEGLASDESTMNGTLDIEISDADLGPMPLIAPLLGDIYSMFRNSIISPENQVNISQAYGEFIIKNRTISTQNALLWGENIAISGDGYMDFDGNLNFTMENKFTQSPVEQISNWQTSLRNTIIRFGKALGKAQLKGTISKPKWVFDYFNDEN